MMRSHSRRNTSHIFVHILDNLRVAFFEKRFLITPLGTTNIPTQIRTHNNFITSDLILAFHHPSCQRWSRYQYLQRARSGWAERRERRGQLLKESEWKKTRRCHGNEWINRVGERVLRAVSSHKLYTDVLGTWWCVNWRVYSNLWVVGESVCHNRSTLTNTTFKVQWIAIQSSQFLKLHQLLC